MAPYPCTTAIFENRIIVYFTSLHAPMRHPYAKHRKPSSLRMTHRSPVFFTFHHKMHNDASFEQ